MEAPPVSAPTPPKSGLAITSLVLGILSLCCLSIVAGIPAVICGHMARADIRKSPAILGGAGMALAGLIMGYLSIALIPILVVFSALAFPAAMQKGHAMQMLIHARQISDAVEAASQDRGANPGLGYPADAGIGSSDQLAQMLVNGNFLDQSDLAELQFDDFEFGNVSAEDADDTIFIRSRPGVLSGHVVVWLKGGEGKLLSDTRPEKFGSDPPRSPAFLP